MKNYIVTLKTKGPVFIGSGETKNKSQYIYDMNRSEVHVIDENKFLTWLVKKGLLSEYEKNFLYTKDNKDLYEWFKRVAPMQRVEDFSAYKLSAKSLSNYEKKRLNDIQTFVKDAYGMPYIPGSSLKGAIRNILFSYKMKNTQNRTFQEYLNSEDNNRNRIRRLEKMANNIDKAAFEFEVDEKIKIAI
ncbi:type III-A CRISPR-associated RAMP protein Csm5 [Peptoniphilus indolicus]|uniref:type III-A CRISPR-associated RAMP protein Csm5 n=1 Tax=Peptoniphilus indolicus TaxID=33030 RepID=UPI0002FDDE34|nr:type III-A CRISPR-associated RAMP protein Csm5 [Peptoniphilus indolicus]